MSNLLTVVCYFVIICHISAVLTYLCHARLLGTVLVSILSALGDATRGWHHSPE
jgi:hypothetical protein